MEKEKKTGIWLRFAFLLLLAVVLGASFFKKAPVGQKDSHAALVEPKKETAVAVAPAPGAGTARQLAPNILKNANLEAEMKKAMGDPANNTFKLIPASQSKDEFDVLSSREKALDAIEKMEACLAAANNPAVANLPLPAKVKLGPEGLKEFVQTSCLKNASPIINKYPELKGQIDSRVLSQATARVADAFRAKNYH